jgi:hypothetical protein
MPERKIKKSSRNDIYNKYRRILKMSDLSKAEIDEMRKNLIFLAQTLCEHVWGKKFY